MAPSLYAGKILSINLTDRTIGFIGTEQYAERFLGGRGIATALYYDMVHPDAGAFDERNCLIMAVGPLAGMPGGLGGSRWGVYCKSPLPRMSHRGKDLFCYGNLGGTFGSELRFAGYDAIVVTGRSERPVYIEIADDSIRFRPADHIWGETTHAAMEVLAGEVPERSRSMVIGPAGENMVPLASILATGDSNCSGGTGSVMGSKNLKAITVRGTHRNIVVENRDRLKEIENCIRSYNRGNTKVWGMDFMAHGPKTTKYPCFGCMAHCLRVKYKADDGTSGKFMCQSRFFYMPHAWGYYNEDNDVPFFANQLCDAYGIDTWEMQSLMEWLLLCIADGIITEEQCGLNLKEVGSLEFIRKLVHMTSTKTGFGEITHRGAHGGGKAIGGKAATIYARTDPYDPRYCTVNTLIFPFESREPIQQLHEAGLVLSQWSSWAKGVKEAHISSDVVRGIAERFWGSADAGDMTTLRGKALAAKKIQDRQIAKECAGFCDWMFPIIDIPTGEKHVGDPAIESRILSAAFNRDMTEGEYYRFGERAFNLQRAIMLREGHRARADDYLPPEWHDRPLETHVADPECLVPGKNGVIVSQIGRKVDRDAFESIRDEYYEYRGWDVKTGLQSEQQLAALGLGHVVHDLAQRDLAVKKSRQTPLAVKAARVLSRTVRSLKGRIPAQDNELLAEITSGSSLTHGEIMAILEVDAKKYVNEKIAHNFAGWTKHMQYHFTDIDAYYSIEFVNGMTRAPVKLSSPLKNPEIVYEMDSRVIKAMYEGRITGEQAYLKRLLRLKAPFTDMMKLQSLSKL